MNENINTMIMELNKSLEEQNINEYINKKIEYAKFCYQNDISTFNRDLDEEFVYNSFIIESEPIIYDVQEELKQTALNKIINNQPLFLDEVEVILQSVVNIARNKLSEIGDINTSTLKGSCGFGQGATYFPLHEIGIQTTVNNAFNLPDSHSSHAFLTCFFNVLENNEVVRKQYLLDVTYRQFFTYGRCNESNFYDGAEGFKNKTAPDAGYFLTQFPEGYNFSHELLKKGYIELTEDNARLYGYGFSCESLSFSNMNRRDEIISHSGKEYIDAINNPILQREIDYDYNELYDNNESPILFQTFNFKSK